MAYCVQGPTNWLPIFVGCCCVLNLMAVRGQGASLGLEGCNQGSTIKILQLWAVSFPQISLLDSTATCSPSLSLRLQLQPHYHVHKCCKSTQSGFPLPRGLSLCQHQHVLKEIIGSSCLKWTLSRLLRLPSGPSWPTLVCSSLWWQ